MWVGYLHDVLFFKNFDKWEKIRDLKSQIDVLRQMLHSFHAAGRYLYAKPAHVFTQIMSILNAWINGAKNLKNPIMHFQKNNYSWSKSIRNILLRDPDLLDVPKNRMDVFLLI